jgi:hypothetical protein
LLLLFETFNGSLPHDEWLLMNFNQTKTSRQIAYHSKKDNTSKAGVNALNNRLNGQIFDQLVPIKLNVRKSLSHSNHA